MFSEALCIIIIYNFFKMFLFVELNVDFDKKMSDSAEKSQLEIRAVIIRCDVNDNLDMSLDRETTRFQREELFKHNSLRTCRQKLSITIKTTSVPNEVYGDKYISLNHVLGANNKKIRLLNPYVVRLRRSLPFEAYTLRKIETVTGILIMSHDLSRTGVNETYQGHKWSQRNINDEWTDSFNTDTFFTNDFGKKVQTSNCTQYVTAPKDKLETRQLAGIDDYGYGTDFFVFNISDPKTTKNIINDTDGTIQINIKNKVRKFDLYEIQNPKLWYNAYVQLFEKLTSPDGKTIWNDLTNGVIASVSAQYPEWSNQKVTIQYKPIKWLANDDFTLSSSNLCLFVPLKLNKNILKESNANFIIVPKDDIVTLEDRKKNKQNTNGFDLHDLSVVEGKEIYRRVAVRTGRALTGSKLNNIKIVSRESERFLKLPYRKPYHTQIDIEARADDNELILVGSTGRLTTIVSDSTRNVRSIISVQAANLGLSAARFRVLIRECAPELNEGSTIDSSGNTASSILLPPRHTQMFRIDYPVTNLFDSAHCTVELINDEDEAVAVRNVRVVKDDQCFCVWHCDCVCLSEDPKLLCQTLSDAQLVAAGLSLQKLRHIRSVCYPDVVTLNLFVTFIGVIFALLLLGIVKACLGLIFRCVGSCGLQLLLQTPRKLDLYYENSLRSRKVVYDKEGWPVHPDTNQRTVRLLSKPMEFTLNLIFFIVIPCLLICDTLKKHTRTHCTECKSDNQYNKSGSKKCFSSHDIQSITTHSQNLQDDLHRWMSPEAEELTTNIWQEGLLTKLSDSVSLLHEKQRRIKSSCLDCEQDDTEFVLTQMQKSKESLSKNLKKPEDFINGQARNKT